MSEFDKELDTLLTSEEATEPPKAPESDVFEETDSVDPSPEPKSGTDEQSPAGGQPDTGQAPPSDDTEQVEQDVSAPEAKTVPLAKLIEQRRTSQAFREHARVMREQNQELQARIEALERERAESTPTPREDDEEVLTRGELRRLQEEGERTQRAQQQQQAAQRVTRAIYLADPNQQRLLTIGEPYLSGADRTAIGESQDPLKTAVALARARIMAYGTEAELDWLQSQATVSQSDSSGRPAPPSTSDSQAKPKSASAQPPPTEQQGPEPDDFRPQNVRRLLDHMFK